MGDPLNEIRMAAFSDELQKHAGIWDRVAQVRNIFRKVPKQVQPISAVNAGVPPATTGGFQEAFSRFLNPGEGLVKGWTHLSPAARSAERAVAGGTTLGRLTPEVTGNLDKAKMTFEALKSQGASRADLSGAAKSLKDAQRTYSQTFGGSGRHLSAPSTTMGEAWRTGGLEGAASEASRRGWTGSGNITRYIPWGGKSLMMGFPLAFDVPALVQSKPATRTGEGAALERGLGAGAGAAGMIAGAGLGLVPGLALWGAGHYLGSKSGRVLDRLRAGASLPEAAMAPSPEQAQSQLQSIAKYYG